MLQSSSTNLVLPAAKSYRSMARQVKGHKESDEYKKTFIKKISDAIASLNEMISDIKEPQKVKVLEDIKTNFTDTVDKANKSSGPINDMKIYESVSSNVEGKEKWPFIRDAVSEEEVKKMFNYGDSDKVKAYSVNKCKDTIIRPLLLLRFLKAHGVFPTNNEVPLYFCKQVIAEVYKQMSVDYTSIPCGTGHGKRKYRFQSPEKKKQWMDPEHLELPRNLARMSKKELLQHSIILTKELQLIISNFGISLENVSSYVKFYVGKLETQAPTQSSGGYQDSQFAFDSEGVNSTVTGAGASHHCLPRDVRQAEDQEQDQIALLQCPNSRHVDYDISFIAQPDFTNVDSQQLEDITCGLSNDTELSESILAQINFTDFDQTDFKGLEFDLAQDHTPHTPYSCYDEECLEAFQTHLDSRPVDHASIPLQEDYVDPPQGPTTDSPGTVKSGELSTIHESRTLDDEERDGSSNASSFTVFINEIPIEPTMGSINVKAFFGPNAILVRSDGQPVLMDEQGLTSQALQQGARYYAILVDSYGQPVLGEQGFTVLALQQGAMYYSMHE